MAIGCSAAEAVNALAHVRNRGSASVLHYYQEQVAMIKDVPRSNSLEDSALWTKTKTLNGPGYCNLQVCKVPVSVKSKGLYDVKMAISFDIDGI